MAAKTAKTAKEKALTREDALRVLFGVITLEDENNSYPQKLKEVLKYDSLGSITQAFSFLMHKDEDNEDQDVRLIYADEDKDGRKRIYRVNWDKLLSLWKEELIDVYGLSKLNADKVSAFFNSSENKLFLKRYLISKAKSSVRFDFESNSLEDEFTTVFEIALTLYFASGEKSPARARRLLTQLRSLLGVLKKETLAFDVNVVLAVDTIGAKKVDFDKSLKVFLNATEKELKRH